MFACLFRVLDVKKGSDMPERGAGVPPKAMARLIEHMGGIENMTPEKLGALTDPNGVELERNIKN